MGILDSDCYQTHALDQTRCLKLFVHVARADKSQDHSRALQVCISPAPKNWRQGLGHPRHIWLRTVEEDLHAFNLGLMPGFRRHRMEQLGGH